jgi:molybdate transport system substrate-binding protein
MSIGAVNVLISGGFTGAYEQLLPEFERSSGVKVTTRSGASQGAGRKRLPRSLPAACVLTW